MTLKAILRRTFRVYVVQLKLGNFSQGYTFLFFMRSRLSTNEVYFQAFKRYFKNPKLSSKKWQNGLEVHYSDLRCAVSVTR